MNYKAKLYAALILGFLGALLSYSYLSHKENELISRASSVKVLVAKKYIPASTRIDQDMVEEKSIPAEFLQPYAVIKSEEVLGQVALAPIAKGEQILPNKFTSTGASLSNNIPEGKRAVAIAVDGVKGVAGLLNPGDYVDVIATVEIADGNTARLMTATILQNIAVVALGQNFKRVAVDSASESQSSRGETTVTLALSPEDVELLTFADERGKLRLALRANGDSGEEKIPSIQSSTLFKKFLGPQKEGMSLETYHGTEKFSVKTNKFKGDGK